MSDEQVKGIPEEGDDFRPNRESLSNAEVRATGLLCQGAVLNIARELIESRGHVARSEQVLAALEARNKELEAALRRLIGACVRPNGMLQPPDVDSEYAARAALLPPMGRRRSERSS